MDTLGNLLSDKIKDAFPVSRIASITFLMKLKRLGIIIKPERVDELIAYLETQLEAALSSDNIELTSSNLVIDIDDEWLLHPDSQATKQVNVISFSDEDIQEFQSFHRKTVEDTMNQTILKTADFLLEGWHSSANKCLGAERDMAAAFRMKLFEVWGKALDMLEMLISISTDLGTTFRQHNIAEAAKNDDSVFEALTHLHARSCQVARAILTLLQNGFADDAHARWRTLYELAVTANFIMHQGNDVATRYLLHSNITIFHEMRKYQQHHQKLHQSPLRKQEIQEIKNIHKALLKQYGKAYNNVYGWAAQALSINNPQFVDIEKNAGLEHMRPYFQMANNNVHAGSKGIAFRLGDPPSGANLLIAGPSIFGLGDPARNSAHSIALVTSTLLLSQTSVDNLATLKALFGLWYEVNEAFDHAETTLKQQIS